MSADPQMRQFCTLKSFEMELNFIGKQDFSIKTFIFYYTIFSLMGERKTHRIVTRIYFLNQLSFKSKFLCKILLREVPKMFIFWIWCWARTWACYFIYCQSSLSNSLHKLIHKLRRRYFSSTEFVLWISYLLDRGPITFTSKFSIFTNFVQASQLLPI